MRSFSDKTGAAATAAALAAAAAAAAVSSWLPLSAVVPFEVVPFSPLLAKEIY
jgi:hypothetical protein